MGKIRGERGVCTAEQEDIFPEVDYSDAKSVIAALQQDRSTVSMQELQRPDRALVLEEVAKWVRSQPEMSELKQGILEVCLILHIPDAAEDGLIPVDPDAAAVIFSILLEEKAGVSSLLYPFLVMLQNEDRGGLFQETDLRRRLPEKMGVPLESIEGELKAALKLLRDRGVLVWYADGGMYLDRHYIQPSREELKAAGYFSLPTVLGETPSELYDVEIPKGLTPFQNLEKGGVMPYGVNMGAAERKSSSDKALLVYIEKLGSEVWVPKSVIHDGSEVYEGGDGEGDLVVKSWWAEKEGWE